MNRNFPIGLLAPLALIAVLLASSFAFAPERVSAHANLARSDPSSGSVLTQAPDRVAIWFTEPLEPEFSEIRVLDVQGERVDNGGSTVDLNDPTAMSVALPPIAPGTYTVAWRNLSSVDGHAVRGSFVFSVGNATAGAAFSSPEPDQKILQSPLEPVVRWLVLMGVLALFGGFVFELLVTRPVLMGLNSSQVFRHLGQRMTSRTFKLVWIAMAVVLIASLAQLVLQTSLVFEVPLHQAIGSNWISILTETRWGNLWLWRVGLLLPIGALVPFHGESYDNRAEFTFRIGRILAGWLSAAILLTISLASHGAATAEIRDSAIFTDFLHLLAAGFWIGGLFHLALVIPLVLQVPSRTQRYGVLVSLLPRFSIVAILSVGTLIVTGLYSGWAQVTAFEAVATPYGRTLAGC
jgi:copper transport protein